MPPYAIRDVYQTNDESTEGDEVQAAPRSVQRIDIVNYGDLILKIASEAEEVYLKVYSQIMKLSCAYFQTMFDSPRKETQSRLQATGSPEVVLRDDDPEAMHRLCKILHHQDEGSDASPLPLLGMRKIWKSGLGMSIYWVSVTIIDVDRLRDRSLPKESMRVCE